MTRKPTRRQWAQHLSMYGPEDTSSLPSFMTKEPIERAKPKRTEDLLQIQLCDWLRLNNYFFWATPNHFYRGKQESEGKFLGYMARQKRMGLVPGVSDLCILRGSQLYCAEVKAPGKYPADNQKAWMIAAEANGAICGVVRTLEQLQSLLTIKPISVPPS